MFTIDLAYVAVGPDALVAADRWNVPMVCGDCPQPEDVRGTSNSRALYCRGGPSGRGGNWVNGTAR